MKKVLLLVPFFKPNYMKNARCMFESWSGTQWHPVLLSTIGCYLEGKGYHVKLIDAQAYSLSSFETGRQIGLFKPDFICVWAGDQSILEDIVLTEKLNQEVAPAKLVGSYLPLHQERYDIKGVTRGLEKGVLDWIEGRADANQHIVGTHLNEEELDAMPFMSEFINRQLDERYYMTPSEPHPFASFFIGRGCAWGNCTFCLPVHTYKKYYTRRSIANVIAEFNYIERHMPHYRSIMIEDDTITAEVGVELSEMKMRAGLKKKWSCYAMANLDYDSMKIMARAGCLNLHVGFESGNMDTLKDVKKGISVRTMEKFVADAHSAGLHIHGDFMIGVDATEEGVQRTIDWACKLNCATVQFQPFIPFFKNENDNFTRAQMTSMAQYAYRKYYGHPAHWWAAVKQIFSKPRILKESIKSLIRPRDTGNDYVFGERPEVSCDV